MCSLEPLVDNDFIEVYHNSETAMHHNHKDILFALHHIKSRFPDLWKAFDCHQVNKDCLRHR